MLVKCNKYFRVPRACTLDVCKEYGSYPEPILVLACGMQIRGTAGVIEMINQLKEEADAIY